VAQARRPPLVDYLAALGPTRPGAVRERLDIRVPDQLTKLADLPCLRTRPSPRPFQRDIRLGLRVCSFVGRLNLDQVFDLKATRSQQSNHVTMPDPKLDVFDGPARSSPLEPVHAEVVSMKPRVQAHRRRLWDSNTSLVGNRSRTRDGRHPAGSVRPPGSTGTDRTRSRPRTGRSRSRNSRPRRAGVRRRRVRAGSED